MPAYIIAHIDITDPEAYEGYKKLVPPTVQKYSGTFLARGGRAELLEGDSAPGRTVVLQFPTFEEAKAWFDSPEYAEAKTIRQAASSGTLILVDGA